MKSPSQKDFEKELQGENICPQCNIEMDEDKKPKKNRFDKERTIYTCYVCGHTHRKRTGNEILRDLGYKK